MISGSSDDMLRRLRSLFPRGWIADGAPITHAVHGGLADGLAWIYGLFQAARDGTRRTTTSGWLLDVDAFGFFGSSFLRRSRETDDAWRKRYTDEIFRPRVTRAAISKALVDLTGRAPQIFEPWNPNDCGAIGIGTIAIAGQGYAPSSASGVGISASGGLGEGHLHIGTPLAPTGVAFAGAGCIGSTAFPSQIFVTAFRPAGRGIPNIPGVGYGGVDGASTEIITDSLIQSPISDAEIFATTARTAGAGITSWVAIKTAAASS